MQYLFRMAETDKKYLFRVRFLVIGNTCLGSTMQVHARNISAFEYERYFLDTFTMALFSPLTYQDNLTNRSMLRAYAKLPCNRLIGCQNQHHRSSILVSHIYVHIHIPHAVNFRIAVSLIITQNVNIVFVVEEGGGAAVVLLDGV